MIYSNKTFGRDLGFDGFCDDVVFENCHFEATDFRELQFDQCEFRSCQFNGVKWLNASFQDCTFLECHLQGADFTLLKSMMLSFTMEQCNIRYANFSSMNLTGCSFDSCDLKGSDFSHADLSKISLQNCVLEQVRFEHATAKGTDFRMAHGLTLNPDEVDLRDALFQLEQLPGLLAFTGIKIDNE